jgi:hypothetical protein
MELVIDKIGNIDQIDVEVEKGLSMESARVLVHTKLMAFIEDCCLEKVKWKF